MSHNDEVTVADVLKRISEEAAELVNAKLTFDCLDELFDTIGWLEAAMMSLPPAERNHLARAIRTAVHTHRVKCADRGLRHLSVTYSFLSRLTRVLPTDAVANEADSKMRVQASRAALAQRNAAKLRRRKPNR